MKVVYLYFGELNKKNSLFQFTAKRNVPFKSNFKRVLCTICVNICLHIIYIYKYIEGVRVKLSDFRYSWGRLQK